VNAPGAVVREGRCYGEMACRGEKLQAELMLPQSGVPLVQAGREACRRLPHQRYGGASAR
jgi:hypothetical protein